jgi:ABC-type uncharacterized transport system permease subunit
MMMFLLGVYLTMATVMFVTVGSAAMLGGRESDLWKPFAFAILWPVLLPLLYFGKVKL